MLVKSLLAGTILSVMAGGAVYYGLGEELDTSTKSSSVLSTESHSQTDLDADIAAVDDDTVIAEATEDHDVAAHPHKRHGTKKSDKKTSDKITDETSSKSTVDRLVRPKTESTPETENTTQTETKVKTKTKTARSHDKMDDPKPRWVEEYLLDEELDIAEEEMDAQAEIEKEIETIIDLGGMDDESSLEPTTTRTIITTETIETTTGKADALPASPKTLTREATGTFIVEGADDKTIERRIILSASPRLGAHTAEPMALNPDTVKLLMDETAKLDIPDMRDQAYMNIVDYALSKGERMTAELALAELSREELRDTARGHVAVSLAKAGRGDAAFDVLSSLEINEMQDPIRLQIIQALTQTKSSHDGAHPVMKRK